MDLTTNSGFTLISTLVNVSLLPATNDLLYNETSTTAASEHAKNKQNGDGFSDQTTIFVTTFAVVTSVTNTVSHVVVSWLMSVRKNTCMVSWWSVLLSIVQWLIFVIGSFGNLSVVLILIWNQSRKQLVTQLFVGSMSLAGLALVWSMGWVQALLYVDRNWKFGKSSCQVYNYVQAAAVYISTWTLATAAFERFVQLQLMFYLVYLIYVRVSTITAIWTVGHRLRSTPTNGHRFTALRLPWRSPIQVLTGFDVA